MMDDDRLIQNNDERRRWELDQEAKDLKETQV